jgi:hypothetical protein
MKKFKVPGVTVAAVFIAMVPPSALCLAAPKPQSLVPSSMNTSPDYFCTWNIQGYYSSYETGQKQKEAVDEKQLFGSGPFQNWLGQFAAVRKDLFMVLDEGWDLPEQQITVVPGRFPFYIAATQPESFKKLSDAVKGSGWRGLGLWMRADKKTDEFWKDRLQWMNASGVSYWKVDYGHDDRDAEWRRHLTEMGREIAPHLIIETALVPESITFGDVYRTYDVDAVLSVPQTLSRVAQSLQFKAEPLAKGIINCEDEVYLGAALGCSYGIMRHNFVGNLPSGRQDFVFPPLARDLKRCGDEVVRAVRWHRLAPAFGVGTGPVSISDEKLTDNWIYQKDESWRIAAGQTQTESAPAIVARGLPLPGVALAKGTIKPFVVASRHPNGALSVATMGRTLSPSPTNRQWITGEVADITVRVGQNSGPIGVFGRYHSLMLVFDKPLARHQIWAQDLASDVPENITRFVQVRGNEVVIPEAVINRVGLSAATQGDKSEPGLVLSIRPN